VRVRPCFADALHRSALSGLHPHRKHARPWGLEGRAEMGARAAPALNLRYLVQLFHHLRVALERADARQALVEVARHTRGRAAHHFLGSGCAESFAPL
jgi:hypothetical protein